MRVSEVGASGEWSAFLDVPTSDLDAVVVVDIGVTRRALVREVAR